VLVDREAGYYREMTRADLSALMHDLAGLLYLHIVCEGQVPVNHPATEGETAGRGGVD